MFEFITVRELYEMFLSNQMMDLEGYEYVELEGWVRTNRNSGKLGFIALNDGTYFKNLQIVYTEQGIDNYAEIDKLSTGSAIRVVGKLKLTPEGKQPFEVEATEIEIAARHILQTRERLNKILAERTGQPLEVIEKDTDRDNYMTAEQAKAYGLIDEVMENSSSLN